jgi:TM2 domain-containing membrane protein YozV
MNTYQNPYMIFPGVTLEEMGFLQQGTAGLDDNQRGRFFAIYSGKRRNPQDILVYTAIGTLGIAGLQRFALGEIFLGLLYFFTFGFFWIGTILDLINYKKLTNDYNHKMAYESFEIMKMGN